MIGARGIAVLGDHLAPVEIDRLNRRIIARAAAASECRKRHHHRRRGGNRAGDHTAATEVCVLGSLAARRCGISARDESGATAIEYGLIAALIAVAAIAAMTTLGTKLTSTFTAVSNQLK
jgi:pilus assembly protein Flp/PilA